MADIIYLDPSPLLDDALIMRLTYDLASGIHEPGDIARRYGFPDKLALRRYLGAHPGIIRNIQKTKALMESEEGSEARVRLKATQATEALIAPTAGIAMDPRTPPQQRIDAFKQLSRVGGLDGSAMAQAIKGGGGSAFTLNILFNQKPPETLTLTPDAQVTTVVNEDPAENDEDRFAEDEE